LFDHGGLGCALEELVEGSLVGLVGGLVGVEEDFELGVVFAGVGVAPDFELSEGVDSHHVAFDFEGSEFLVEYLVGLEGLFEDVEGLWDG
jgi:hypothetical protein